MAIFKNTPVRSNPVDNRTLDQKKEAVKRDVINMGQRHYDQLCRIQKEGIDIMWNNPTLTPQEVSDAVGVDAAVLISAHGDLTEAIIKAATSSGIEPNIKLPTNAFVINQDGTVTISEDPYVP